MKGLYIHIPFCASICSYCDFPKEIAKEGKKEVYMHRLIEEIQTYKEELTDIRSVYIGGGTPNALNLALLEKLLKTIEPYLLSSKENTIEINTELFTEDQVKLFKKYHINRVSLGVQTFQSHLLPKIRRKHTKEMVHQTISVLRSYEITNINLDMMYGLPGQTMEDIQADLTEILSLNVPHISYYSLILEEKTLLEYQLKHHQLTIPEDDLVADMALYINQVLKKNMFKHYEISNYAKEGYASIHNLGYWDTEPYIGVGAGACGYLNHKRYQNHKNITAYFHTYKASEDRIDLQEAKKEFMMLGLRKMDGIHSSTYFARFKTYPRDDFDIDKLLKLGLIEEKNDVICLKEDKFLIANVVFEEFV